MPAAYPEKVGHGGIRASNIRGFEKVIENLNIEILKLTEGTRLGLLRAAKFIQRDIETVEPLTPVLTDTMRLSWTVKDVHQGGKGHRQFGIQFGYPEDYALWVHEMVDAKNWTRPGSGPKWLERSINRNHDEILYVITDSLIRRSELNDKNKSK